MPDLRSFADRDNIAGEEPQDLTLGVTNPRLVKKVAIRLTVTCPW